MLIFTYYDETSKFVFMKSMESVSRALDNAKTISLVILSNSQPSAKEISQLNTWFSTTSVIKPTRVKEPDTAISGKPNTEFVEILLTYSAYDQLYVDPNIILTNKLIIPIDTSLFFKQYRGQLSTKLVYLKAGTQFNTAFSTISKGKWITNITDMEFTYVVHNNFLIPKKVHPNSILNGKAFSESAITNIVITDQAAMDISNVDLQNSKIQKILTQVLPSTGTRILSRILKKSESSELVPFSALIGENKEVAIMKPKPKSVIKHIVMELPFYDKTSGGINRSLRIVMELPYYSKICGGVRDSVLIAQQFTPTAELRFQRLISESNPAELSTKWSVGLPDESFPTCDICITYSDNLYLEKLVNLPQVGKVYILMLSYGMNLPVERANVLNPKVTVLCSSKKLEKAISEEKVKVYRLGLGLDMSAMYVDKEIKRKKYLAILYNNMLMKKYTTAVEVANTLYKNKIIDGVITFGREEGYSNFPKPIGLVKHYAKATPDQIREIFNTCQCFLMPSVTEGLNLTPIESTLCGCPAILCDGAINEVFFDRVNCFISPPEDTSTMVALCTEVMNKFNKYSNAFRKDMQSLVDTMTWPAVYDKLTTVLLETEPKNVVIIPVHNQLDYLKSCVKTVVEKTDNLKLIIVNDGSTDKEINSWVQANIDCTLINHETPQGFSAACNDGIDFAMKNFDFHCLCLLNSDTEIITDGWFDKIEREMRRHDLGIAGPVSNNAVCQTVREPFTYMKNIETKPVIYTPLVHGFCYFIRKDVITKIGMLDGILFPHYGSEDDYSLRSLRFGFRSAIVGSVFVKHNGEASYSPSKRAELLKTSVPNLSKRWGNAHVSECVSLATQAFKKLNEDL
jgi:GT2 family glycosyltransferase